MDLGSILLIVATIFILVVSLFLTERWLPKDALKIPETTDIPKFSANVHFDPYPSVVNIENQYDCNAQSLRKCDINDNTTLFGCKELTARCRHFDKDLKYYTEGKELIIPKNSSPTEGYALAITTLAEACNPYHGDLVLVAANKESTEYMLICSCKNPGFIGNEHLLGNCTDVFVCDGKIDNIDQPFEKINCVCEDGKISKRKTETDAPTCQILTVNEANKKYKNWSHLVDLSNRFEIPKSSFNPTIRDNLNIDSMVDPCSYSLLDYSQPIPTGRYSNISSQCVFDDGGIPVHTGMLTKPRFHDSGADSVLPSGKYQYLRFTDNVAGQRRRAVIYTTMDFHPTRRDHEGLVLIENAHLGDLNVQIRIPTREEFIAPRCSGSWPTYTCRTDNGSTIRVLGIPMAQGRPCPSEFLWGREYWDNAEYLTTRSITTNLEIGINQKTLTESGILNFYGITLQNAAYSRGERNGLLRMIEKSDYQLHKNSIT